MRARGQSPAFFHVQPHIHYLREDVICWLRERYQSKETVTPIPKKKKPLKRAQKKRKEAVK
jgi:hypothetical protein